MSPIDREAHLNRWRRKPLAEKTLLALGLLVLALALKPAAAVLVASTMSAAALVGARVSPRLWFGCMAAPLGFLAVGVVTLALRVDAHGIGLAPGGFAEAGALVARSVAGLTCMLFLALTTPASDLVGGLGRLGLPSEIVDLALLMYRFLFILGDSAVAMDAAQAARLGHATARRRVMSAGLIAANLLPRALDRARRMEIALASRGWRGEMRVLADRTAATASGLAAISATLAAIALVGLFA
ncbi:cobalt ECF transporter T component CbiQ [Rhodoblastus sphagnicola]|uniref:Cobalt ECF transporter T component CbiQ n=1 Tax=Rhodoblastus sphagnicola TaxID=333368 RepID=A0A2S6NE98_9HYPH|nr:cobalt ECF transporter T component CbiQ [Rhodoblastus sphagnicola]MBB4199873.1 cobalt/nickel transport system permease protein [Rhodoblastus sphagnicola]PPQ32929.1 cobalt ECF transporter T component CbiQ [Rhodoblastus sphagnicola]